MTLEIKDSQFHFNYSRKKESSVSNTSPNQMISEKYIEQDRNKEARKVRIEQVNAEYTQGHRKPFQKNEKIGQKYFFQQQTNKKGSKK